MIQAASLAPVDSAIPVALNSTNVAILVRDLLPGRMESEMIPGAAIAVVKSGRLVWEHGFGFANLKTETPVSAEQSVFRVASISKIFTAAAVLGLREKGELDLHTNVNEYLENFDIPDAFNRPVTLADLLTHTAGFDFRRANYASLDLSKHASLEEYLEEAMPERVRPPGVLMSYDNYGYALAGFVVQEVAGESFPRFMSEELLQPLAMEHSTFASRPNPQAKVVTGYRLEDNTLHPLQKDVVTISPAAGLFTTAGDMSRFLRILTGPMTTSEGLMTKVVRSGLTTPEFIGNPAVPGRCYGFNQVLLNGRRVLLHTGNWPGFCSLVAYFPTMDAGLFLVYNRNDRFRLARALIGHFAGEFLPPKITKRVRTTAAEHNSGHLNRFVGTYLSLRYSEDAPAIGVAAEKLVEAEVDGDLMINGKVYHRIAKNAFERSQTSPDSGDWHGVRVAFIGQDDKAATHLITESGTYRRAAWYETVANRKRMLRAAVVVLLTAMVWWPIAALVKVGRFLPAMRDSENGAASALPPRRWLMRSVALVTALFATGLIVAQVFVQFGFAQFPYVYGMPDEIIDLRRVGVGLIILALGTTGCAFATWWRGDWSLGSRLHYSLVCLAVWVVCGELLQQNLVGW